jgi:Fe2+ transport system protein FeoA
MTQNQPIDVPVPAPAPDLKPLSELGPGQEAIVAKLIAKGAIRQRLLEMGFVRGARLKVVKLAPLGDPMQLLIKGYQLSLRREESACILVEDLVPAPARP